MKRFRSYRRLAQCLTYFIESQSQKKKHFHPNKMSQNIIMAEFFDSNDEISLLFFLFSVFLLRNNIYRRFVLCDFWCYFAGLNWKNPQVYVII